MTERTIYDCDRCAAKGIADWHITVEFGWVTDPAGGPGSPRQERFDLCPACRNATNKKLMALLTDQQRRELLEFLATNTRRARAWNTAEQREVKLWEVL